MHSDPRARRRRTRTFVQWNYSWLRFLIDCSWLLCRWLVLTGDCTLILEAVKTEIMNNSRYFGRCWRGKIWPLLAFAVIIQIQYVVVYILKPPRAHLTIEQRDLVNDTQLGGTLQLEGLVQHTEYYKTTVKTLAGNVEHRALTSQITTNYPGRQPIGAKRNTTSTTSLPLCPAEPPNLRKLRWWVPLQAS